MASFNSVTVVGNVAFDPELKYSKGGTAFTTLRLAVNESWHDKATNQKREETLWIDAELWGKQAEHAVEYLSKGRSVLVSGRLKLDEWTANDGSKRSKIYIKADVVQFLGGKDRELQRQEMSGEESQVVPAALDDIPAEELPF